MFKILLSSVSESVAIQSSEIAIRFLPPALSAKTLKKTAMMKN